MRSESEKEGGLSFSDSNGRQELNGRRESLLQGATMVQWQNTFLNNKVALHGGSS